MAESPPTCCLIGRYDDDIVPRKTMTPSMLRRSPCKITRASPKTPTHPSNGYQVMVDEQQAAGSSSDVKMSSPPGSLVLFGHAKEVSDDGSSSSSSHSSYTTNARRASSAPPSNAVKSLQAPTLANRPTPDEEDRVSVVAAVSLEEDASNTEIVVVSRATSVIAAKGNVGATTPSKSPRRRRKSAMDDAAPSKTARRRSLRLSSKPCEPNSATDEEQPTTSDGMEEAIDVFSKTSPSISRKRALSSTPRRRSLRVQDKVSCGESPAFVGEGAKKRQAKRRQSDVHGTGKKEDCVLPFLQRIEVEQQDRSNLSQTGHCDETSKGLSVKTACNSVNRTSCPKELNLEGKVIPLDSLASFQIGLSENGHVMLAQALEKMAIEVVFGPLSFENVSMRKGSGRRRSRKRGRGVPASVLSSLDSGGEEACSADGFAEKIGLDSSGTKARPKNRRDTFDLSKKRGLTGAPKRDLEVFIDKTAVSDESTNVTDYVTPKAGSVPVDVDAIMKKMSSTLGDGPEDAIDDMEAVDETTMSVVKENLRTLTSVAVQERMAQLFQEQMKEACKYPCVSARIFAAMSLGYEDQSDFTILFPFLLSLVDAEIVSLKSKEENEVCFINKKVCFSGFDYSSTKTAVGAVVGQGGGDLLPNIEALEAVLQQALKLSRPMYSLDLAIQCLQCMVLCDDVSKACAETMFGYFPSARFQRALKYYMDELRDVKRYVSSQSACFGDDHFGVRYRLNDFIGRSVRFHLRELLNTIPESVVDFNVDECEERWGRAVDDRSISSILNFSLEKIYEFMAHYPDIFDYGMRSMPQFFAREASAQFFTLSKEGLKNMDKAIYEGLVMDITEARSFLFGARACKFVYQLLNANGVVEHIDAVGGWANVQAIASTFYKLNIYMGSENEHFVQLREIRDLIFMLEDVDSRLEPTVDKCEFYIRTLWKKLSFNTKSLYINNLKAHLGGEKGECFPLVITQ